MNNEQKLIKEIFSPIAKNPESLSLNNDAAILKEKKMVVSTDMMIEDHHFDANYDPKILAKKLLRINLSDIASMGAVPYGYLLNISIPNRNSKKWLKDFASGLKDDNKKFKIKLFGGDLCSSEKIYLSATFFGVVKNKAHLHFDIKMDSEIFVSNFLGDASLGFEIHNRKNLSKSLPKISKEYLLNKFYLPEPDLKLGVSLLGIADFCTDISDGLDGELNRICSFKKLRANISLSQLPVSDHAKNALKELNLKQNDFWKYVIFNGEDYNLLFSVRKKNQLLSKFKKIKNIKKIGYFDKGRGVRFLNEENSPVKFDQHSFSHF